MERGRVVRATRLLTAPVGVAFAALALVTHVATDRHDGRSHAQRDYEAISHSTESPCTPDPAYGNPMCVAPNSTKADLSVTATASRTGNDITIRAVVRNHQWANATASRFWLSVGYHPGKSYVPQYRSVTLVSGVSSVPPKGASLTECRQNRCEIHAPLKPGAEIGVEMTLYSPDASDVRLFASTLDYDRGYLELDEEDNRIIIPVGTGSTEES